MVAANTMLPTKLAALCWRAETTKKGTLNTAAISATPWLTLLAISSPWDCTRLVIPNIVHVAQGICIHVELLGCGVLKSEAEAASRYACPNKSGDKGTVLGVIGNILWFIFGGFVMGLGWWLAGLLAAITIVGIPWAKACFVIGQFAFLSFGKEAISRKALTSKDDIGTGALGMVGNILWFVFARVWLAIGHLGSALLCFITIIGIPFGIQRLKLAALAMAPIGQTIVDKGVAARARQA
jgi:uncharacterized membrane protein YccF (DUF307 family)